MPEELEPMTPEQSEFFLKMYHQYNRFFVYILKEKKIDNPDRDDIMQDSLFRLMKKVETLMDLEPPALRTYIYRAVCSAIADYFHKKYPEYAEIPMEEDMLDLERTQWDMASDLYRSEQIKKLRKELPEHDWLALEGKYMYGYSNSELGERMGVKTNSVHTLMGRIHRKAQKILLGGSLIGGGGNER